MRRLGFWWCLLSAFGKEAGVHGRSNSNDGVSQSGRKSDLLQIRGGEPTAEPLASVAVQSMAAVFRLASSGAISWLVGDDAAPYSAVLFGEDPSKSPVYEIPHLPQDEKMMGCLGLLSDVIVVVLPADSAQALNLADGIEENLRDIADAKQVRNMPKGRLVIVSEMAYESWWIRDLVQQRLRTIAPSRWETFDVMTPDELHRQWQSGNILDESSRNIANLLPFKENAKALTRLVKQAYRYLGGATEDIVDESMFALYPVRDPQMEIAPLQKDDAENKVRRPDEDPQDRVQRVLVEARRKLATLESTMQDLQLESHSSSQMPMLDFGVQSNTILEEAFNELEHFPPSLRTGFMQRLVSEVQQLYKDQLQSLRDYYGKRYELSLEREDDETAWAVEAEHLTQGFQAAAQHAVPMICQDGSPLAGIDSFDSTNALKGLLQDMIEATQDRKNERSLEFDEEDLEHLSPKRRRIPPWVKKIASRALALGINYIQGWLAWQGVKRAALERDREMPKFPLF